MSSQSFAPYRDFMVDVRVTTAGVLCLHDARRRYRVSWMITPSSRVPRRKIGSFPEQRDFVTEADAFKYALKRAHTFIDCMLANESDL